MSEVMEAPAIEKAPKAKAPKMYKLTIHSGDDEGDKGDVFIGYNGKSFLIQRDQEVIVPEYIIDGMRDTVIETSIREKDGTTKIVKIPRFSYNVAPA